MSGDGEMGVLISQSPAISRSPFVPTLACLCTNWSYTLPAMMGVVRNHVGHPA